MPPTEMTSSGTNKVTWFEKVVFLIDQTKQVALFSHVDSIDEVCRTFLKQETADEEKITFQAQDC